jgi:HEAT repeat protein
MSDDASPENLRKITDEVKLKPVKTWFIDILTNPSYNRGDDKVEIGNVKADIALADEVGVGDESMDMICESLNDDYSAPFTLDVNDLISKAEKNIREGNLSEAEKLFKEANELGSRKYPPSDPKFTRSKTRNYTIYDGVYRAARALGNLGDFRAAAPLIKALDENLGDAYFPQIIVEALGKIANPEALDTFEKMLESRHPPPSLIDNTIYALDKIGGKRAAEILVKSSRTTAYAVWYVLENIGEPAVNLLIEVISSKNEDTRYVQSAAETLGNIGDKRAVKPLVKLLKNSFPSETGTMLYAARALNNLAEQNQHDDTCESLPRDNAGVLIDPSDRARNRFLDYHYSQCSCIMSDPSNHLGKNLLTLLEKHDEDEINLKAIYMLARGVKHPILKEDEFCKARSKELIAIGERAIEPIIEYYSANGEYYGPSSHGIIEILVKITEAYIKTKEKKEILKFLESNDQALIMMGASMLKGLMKNS